MFCCMSSHSFSGIFGLSDIHIWMYQYMHKCIYVYVHIYTCVPKNRCKVSLVACHRTFLMVFFACQIYIYLCIYAYLYVYVDACIYIYIYTHLVQKNACKEWRVTRHGTVSMVPFVSQKCIHVHICIYTCIDLYLRIYLYNWFSACLHIYMDQCEF